MDIFIMMIIMIIALKRPYLQVPLLLQSNIANTIATIRITDTAAPTDEKITTSSCLLFNLSVTPSFSE